MEAVQTITRSIVNEAVIRDCFVALLDATRPFRPVADDGPAVMAVRKRFERLLEELLYLTLLQAVTEDDEHLGEIRRFFLEPRAAYTLNELAAIWRITIEDAADICHDELAVWENSSGSDEQPFRVCWTQAVDTTVRFNLLRPFDIERALGDRLLRAQTAGFRTIPVLIRLPRLVAEALELDPAMPRQPTLAHRIEQVVLEVFWQRNSDCRCETRGRAEMMAAIRGDAQRK